MSAAWLCATSTVRKGADRLTISGHTHAQTELTFMAISDRLVAEPSEFRLSNITCSSDLHTRTYNHIHHSNGSIRIPSKVWQLPLCLENQDTHVHIQQVIKQ